MCCMLKINDAKITKKNRHLRTIAQGCPVISSQRRHLLTIGKNLLNSNISSTYVLTNGCDRLVSLGHPSKFQRVSRLGFVRPILHRRRSTEVNQTLHDVWPSPGLVEYIYTFGGSCPLTEFCHVQNPLCVQVLRSPMLAALLHGTRITSSDRQSNFAAWYKEWNYGTVAYSRHFQ